MFTRVQICGGVGVGAFFTCIDMYRNVQKCIEYNAGGGNFSENKTHIFFRQVGNELAALPPAAIFPYVSIRVRLPLALAARNGYRSRLQLTMATTCACSSLRIPLALAAQNGHRLRLQLTTPTARVHHIGSATLMVAAEGWRVPFSTT